MLPSPDKPKTPPLDAGGIIRWLESLKKCAGWTEWLLPKLTIDLEGAKVQILEAVEAGVPPDSAALATYRTLNPLFQMLRDMEARARAQILNPVR
jgi:hypothetical protein